MKAIVLAIAFMAVGTAHAQNYPSKPVRIVVPYAAGGAVDVVGRLISPKMAEAFGQPVLIDNRPGAGGNIGADLVAKSAPDGYSVLLAPIGQATSPALYRKLSYDPMDLTGVTQLIATEFVLVSYPKLPAVSVKEMVALSKTKPGGLNYGSTGVGAAPHLAVELMASMSGAALTHVPYKGDAPLNAALMAGEVDVAIVPISTALPFITGGKIRALGSTGAKRARTLPDVPAVAESVPGYEFTSWQSLFVPSKTSREAVQRLYRESVRAVNLPDVREKLQGMGSEIVGSTPDEFEARYKSDIARFARVVKEAKIPLQD